MQVIGTKMLPNVYRKLNIRINGVDVTGLHDKRPQEIVSRINTFASQTNVTASLTADKHLQLDSPANFTLAEGDQFNSLAELGLTAQ